jgi:hypothetical protein
LWHITSIPKFSAWPLSKRIRTTSRSEAHDASCKIAGRRSFAGWEHSGLRHHRGNGERIVPVFIELGAPDFT